MDTMHQVLRKTATGSKHIALACGLLLAAAGQAQTYSSSTVSYTPQYSSQSSSQSNAPYTYNQNQQEVTPPRNEASSPRYKGEGWAHHFVFEGGGGGSVAVGSTQNLANPGWNVLLGTGFRFNNRLSLLAEWNFNDMGVPHSVATAVAQVPGGNEHIWTVDLNPKFNLIRTGRFNGYVIGGGGFSRALVNYTYPVVVPCGYGYGYGFYGYGYGYGGCTGNVTVAHTSSNQGNFDIGMGGEWRISPYSRGKIFLEARYLEAYTPKNGLPPGYNATIVPITIGFRW